MALSDNCLLSFPLTGAPYSDLRGGAALTVHGVVAVTGGRRGGAATFTATSGQFLSRTSPPAAVRGDNDWTWMGWIRLDSVAAQQYAVTLGSDWYLTYESGTGNFRFTTTAGASPNAAGTAPAVGQWHAVKLTNAKTRGKVSIAVDGGAAVEASTTGPMSDGGDDLRFGALFSGGLVGLNGALRGWNAWSREVTNAEWRQFYAAGCPLDYPFDSAPVATAQSGVAGTSGHNTGTGLAGWQTALAGAAAAVVDVVVIGDSITEGFEAGRQWFNSSDLTLIGGAEAGGYVDRLRTRLQYLYGGTSRGFFDFSTYQNDSLYPNLKWGFSGANITPPAPNDWGVRGYTHGVGGLSGQNLTAAMQYGDTFDVFLLEGSGLSTGIVTVQIDGESPVTVGTGTPPVTPAINKYTVTSTGGVGVHTVKLIASSTLGINCYWVAVVPRVAAETTGVRVHRAASAGAVAGDMLGNDDLLKFLDPFSASPYNTKLVVVALGVNDLSAQTALATYKAHLQRLLDKVLAWSSAPDVLLVGGNPRFGSFTIPQTSYNQQLTDLSDADPSRVAVVNMYSRWVSVANADSLALTPGAGDVHPTDLGHDDYAAEILYHLTTTPSAVRGRRSLFVRAGARGVA